MFCPSCGTDATDQTKYCTKCGTGLQQIREAMSKTESEANPWHASLHLAQQAHKQFIEHEWPKRTPEEKRLMEIKGGVITSSVGMGLLIFLWMLFNAIAGVVADPERDILLALRFVGIIPFLIGIGILFNGLVVSKRAIDKRQQQEREDPNKQPLFSYAPQTAPVQRLAEAPPTPVSNFSVTETTTTKLREPVQVSAPQDN